MDIRKKPSKTIQNENHSENEKIVRLNVETTKQKRDRLKSVAIDRGITVNTLINDFLDTL
jgi:hypothetical protein